jgi:hypothetical protein
MNVQGRTRIQIDDSESTGESIRQTAARRGSRLRFRDPDIMKPRNRKRRHGVNGGVIPFDVTRCCAFGRPIHVAV